MVKPARMLFWAGNITLKAANQPHIPLLLIPVGKTDAGVMGYCPCPVRQLPTNELA
jgi:hypothetical protein